MQRNVAQYGAWKSPITSDLIVSESITLAQPAIADSGIFWVEARPSEAGRNVLVRRDSTGEIADGTPAPYNVRSRVHEYGGGAYRVDGQTVYFSNFADGRLYAQRIGGDPEPMTPEAQYRFADMVVDRSRNRLICIREDHSASDREAVNSVVGVSANSDGGQQVLVAGNDFYSSPRVSPDGTQLAWLTWNHPNMPWDGTELWVARITEDGSLEDLHLIAGGRSESIVQPEWSPDGVLYFSSDRTGWWNLYRVCQGAVERVADTSGDIGGPAWVFGQSFYSFESPGRIICTLNQHGTSRLISIATDAGTVEAVDTPFSTISNVQTAPGKVVFLGGSPVQPHSVVELELHSHEFRVLKQSSSAGIDAGYLSVPETIEFPTEGGHTAFGFFYPPRNAGYEAPPGERPPLIVRSHGGPTGVSSSSFNLSIQYWTSRGFAALDVNYGGSTSFGREYRERLKGNWGVVDVDDCVNGALFVARQGRADPSRLIIVGGSAGGYTTLCALTFRDVFSAGASYYGVGDLIPLAVETHKFESRYLDGLIGPYPERKDLYIARSPIHFTDRLSCPVILFQGLDDRVVPPNQAELMAEALRVKGLPCALVTFEGEGHGFRKAESIKRMLDGELYFYSQVFGFEPADDLDPVHIENRDALQAYTSTSA